jgi:hypothetical protein
MKAHSVSVRFGLLFFCVFFLFQSGVGRAFYCGNSVVKVGDSAEYVLACCGEPDNRQKINIKVRHGSHWEEKKDVREIWTYNFGSTKFVQYLTIENGVVIEIKQGGYGTDE